MSLATNIRAWRLFQRLSTTDLAGQAGLSEESLEAIETGASDPSASVLAALASAFGIPNSWLYGHPSHMDLLLEDGEQQELLQAGKLDPVTDRILRAMQKDCDLYVLLTAILTSGDPKLRLAATANLRSLATQLKQPDLPWETRKPGHFEPPSD
jgi:transcriptional regulator with XRE-family HTH domain